METFNIEKFSPERNYVLSASAGTGKTYNIVQIVAKLIENGIGLDKMLIVTYTEKAAGELKDRIRTKLGASADVDSAMIGTIHSFCQKTAEEFFISIGKTPRQTKIGTREERDFIRRYIREGKLFEDICEFKSRKPESNIEDRLEKRFFDVLEKYYLDRSYQPDSGIVSLASYPNDFDNKSLKEIFLQAEESLKALEKRQNYDFSNFLHDIDRKTFDFDGRIHKANKDMGDERPLFERITKYITTVKDLVGNDKKVDKVDKYLSTYYAADLYEKWQKEKEKRQEQTFSDMIRTIREEIVSNGPLVKKLQDKYSYAVIDEFQDTNQLQWDIFSKVFLQDDNHHITVVGDEKQSIYSFQGADVTVYKKAIEEIVKNGGERYCLGTNYRSTEKMIDSINAFFEGNIDGFSASECGEKRYQAYYDNKETEAFWILPRKEENKYPTEYEYAHAVCERIVDFCSADDEGKTKLRLCDKKGDGFEERNVTFGDFAILARSRSEMEPIEKELQKCGIPYLRYKDNSLFGGRECAGWIALLNAIDAPDFSGDNRALFRKALYSIFFDYSLDEVNSSEFEKDSGKEIELFGKWRLLAAECKWEELIDSIILDTELGDKLELPKQLNTFGIIKQLGDYCVNYLSGGKTISSLVKHLNRCVKNNEETENENDALVARSTDFNCVKLMTIHASKGLEFPIVISVAGFKGKNNNVSSYSYHEKGDRILSFDTSDQYKEEMAAEWERLYYVAYTRAKFILMLPEYKRIEDFSFISGNIRGYIEKENSFHGIQNDDECQCKELKEAVERILQKNNCQAKASETEKENQKNAQKNIVENTYRHASYKNTYSSLSHSKKEENIGENGVQLDHGEETAEETLSGFDRSAKAIPCEYDSTKEPVKPESDYPAGTGLGNALHEVLERADYQNDPELLPLIKECFAKQGFKKNDRWAKDSEKMIRQVLEAKLPVIKGSERVPGESFVLSEIAKTERINEAEFNFNVGNERLHRFFNGFVDLVFRREEYYSVLDWKSDRLNENFTSYGDLECLKAHVDELYSIQRVLYSYCLIKWLENYHKGQTDEEIFEKHFGGVYYVFLRGCNAGTGNGIYAQTWRSFADLEKEYDEILKQKLHIPAKDGSEAK